MKKLIIIVIVSAALAGAIGAEPLNITVEQAVDMAVAQNLGLKQSGIELRTKQRARDARWGVLIPSMGLTAGFNGTNQVFTDYGVAIPTAGEASALRFSTGLNIGWPLNMAMFSASKQLISDYEAGLIGYEAAQKQLERDVRKQFFLLLGNKENIRIQEANMALAKKRLDQARNNFRNGLAPELEVLSAEVTLANMQPAYNGALANYESLFLYFKFLIGEDRKADIALSGNLETELYDLDAEGLINAYIARRLDIKQLNQQIVTMEYTKKTVKRNSNTPYLSLGYNYGINGSNKDFDYGSMSAVEPWSDWSDNGQFSLSLSWNFDGFIPSSKTDTAIKEIQDGIDSLDLARQMALENAGIEITNLVNKLNTSRKTIEANTSSVELARRNFQLTEEAYNVGTRELLDVESAQNDFLAAAQQLLLAKYEYIAGLLDLEFALNATGDEFLK